MGAVAEAHTIHALKLLVTGSLDRLPSVILLVAEIDRSHENQRLQTEILFSGFAGWIVPKGKRF